MNWERRFFYNPFKIKENTANFQYLINGYGICNYPSETKFLNLSSTLQIIFEWRKK